MRCKKYCKCNECEMLQMDSIVAIDDRNPFNEKRVIIPMLKCMQFAVWGETDSQLKNERFTDDFVRGEEAIQLIEDYEAGFHL